MDPVLLEVASIALASNIDDFTFGLVFALRGLRLGWRVRFFVALVAGCGILLGMLAGRALSTQLTLAVGRNLSGTVFLCCAVWFVLEGGKGRKADPIPECVSQSQNAACELSANDLRSCRMSSETVLHGRLPGVGRSFFPLGAPAVLIAVALGVDSLLLGVGAGLATYPVAVTAFATAAMSFAGLTVGELLGRRVEVFAGALSRFLAAVLLVLLAVRQLLVV